MKPLLALFSMFFLGSVLGYQAAFPILSWSSSCHLSGVWIPPADLVTIRLKLALGAGALFAAAVLAPTVIARSSRPVLWSVVYLAFGLLLCAAGAAHYRLTCASIPGGSPEDLASEQFTAENSPVAWELLILAACLLAFGLVHRSVLGLRAQASHRATNAR